MHGKSTTSYVLEVCRSKGRHFSLRDVIVRIHEERPELAEEFPSIWGDLIRLKKVRVCSAGETMLYEVVKTSHEHLRPTQHT